MKKVLMTLAAALAAIVVIAGVVIGAGWYNVAADSPHTGPVFRLLETARERSIASRAGNIEVPDLKDAARVRRGAGNYDSMCKGCHLRPGMQATELSAGLYPAPPDFSKHAHSEPAEAFWVIKHGIKASGMPAWGKSMQDSYIWDLVAFIGTLPSLSAEEYRALVAASGGHSHEGGESMGAEDDHDEPHAHEPDRGH